MTAHPTAPGVNQQARNFLWHLEETDYPAKDLIRDHDSKYAAVFNAVFETEGIAVIKTPIRAPKATAHAERWLRSVREECLDPLISLDQHHLHSVLAEYVDDYHHARLHQGIDQRMPIPLVPPLSQGVIERWDDLQGLNHADRRVA